MGACLGKSGGGEDDIHRLLLLGNGGSGKSTLFKQLRILNTSGIEDEARKSATLPILNNLLGSCVILVNLCEENKLDLPDSVTSAAEGLDVMVLDDEDDTDAVKELHRCCSVIWSCDVIKNDGVALSQKMDSEKDQLDPNAVHFLDSMDRICAPGYIPTDEDILKQRRSTSGSHKMMFDFDPAKYDETGYVQHWEITDIGGQVHERHLWAEQSQDLTGLIYVLSLSDFDQRSQDNRGENKFLDDGVGTLCDVLNQKAVQGIPILIMLNKIDIFRDKIKGGPGIGATFQDYAGKPADETASIEYMKGRIKKIVMERTKCKVMNMFVTCATDTDMMRNMIKKMIDTIHKHNMQLSGMHYD